MAAGAYADPLRAALIAHKERGIAAVRSTLSLHLATATGPLLPWPTVARRGDAVLLVPVPSRPTATLRRGEDPLRLLATGARDLLRDAVPTASIEVAPLLRLRGAGSGVRDQAGLGRAARARNLAGALAVRPTVLDRVRRRHGHAHVLLLDDVVTTGATLREADRALRAVGLRPAGAAVVAAAQFHTTSSAGTLPPPRATH